MQHSSAHSESTSPHLTSHSRHSADNFLQPKDKTVQIRGTAQQNHPIPGLGQVAVWGKSGGQQCICTVPVKSLCGTVAAYSLSPNTTMWLDTIQYQVSHQWRREFPRKWKHIPLFPSVFNQELCFGFEWSCSCSSWYLAPFILHSCGSKQTKLLLRVNFIDIL